MFCTISPTWINYCCGSVKLLAYYWNTICPLKMKKSRDTKTTACRLIDPIDIQLITDRYSGAFEHIIWKVLRFSILLFRFHCCGFRPNNNYPPPRWIRPTVTTTLRISFLHTSFCVAAVAVRFRQTLIAYLAHMSDYFIVHNLLECWSTFL